MKPLQETKFRPNKLLGQHFLNSRAVLEKIVAAADLSPNDTVLEIGPGLGALTQALAKRASAVVAVEKDRRLAAVLEETLREKDITNVRITVGDILKLTPDRLGLPRNYVVVANIPYYLTARLLKNLLVSEHPPRELFLMVQKEVAERISAKPPRMNLLALAVQVYGKPKTLFTVSRNVFTPRPKVDSALIRIRDIRKRFFTSRAIDEEKFFTVLHAAFRGKRKVLENSLSENLSLPKQKILFILKECSLAGKRPEALSLSDWANLVRALS